MAILMYMKALVALNGAKRLISENGKRTPEMQKCEIHQYLKVKSGFLRTCLQTHRVRLMFLDV